MINVKSAIYNALTAGCPLADVSDEFPKEWRTFPKITYTEEQNEVYEWTDNEEKSARVVFRIDVWDKQNAGTTAGLVDDALSAIGLKRTMAMDSPVKEMYKHKVMRYEALIDAEIEHVFHE